MISLDIDLPILIYYESIKPYVKNFVDYLEHRGFKMYTIHTSGHADITALKRMVDAIKPQNIVPIHTFAGARYKDIFNRPVKELADGQIMEI